MYPVTQTFLAALRRTHAAVVQVDAYRDDVLIAADLPVQDGTVTVDVGSKVRRILSITLAPGDDLWDLLAPVGTELRPKRGIRYPSGAIEWVPLGRFDVDVQSMGYAPGGTLNLTAPDRWALVQRAKFETPELSVPGALASDEMARLVTDAIPGVTVINTATSVVQVGAVVWDRDRDAAIEAMGKAIGAEAFFDVDDRLVIRDIPTLDAGSSWLIDASQTGVLLAADRERNRQRTFNVVVASSSAVDGSAPFTPVTVEDDDPDSLTFVDGPFGRVPYFYASPLLLTSGQATAAAETLLEQKRGLAAQLTLESIVNPALDAGDVLDVLLPAKRIDMPRPIEKHMADKITIPLLNTGKQTIATRSSRPEED